MRVEVREAGSGQAAFTHQYEPRGVSHM